MSDLKQNFTFSLDIGTRSVTGLIVKIEGETISLIDHEIMEHKERSMIDGQIHDVVEVSRVIKQVKTKLEERNGPLGTVAVAAAGRSLRTKRVQYEQDISEHTTLTRNDILTMELAAVQEAQHQVAQERNQSNDSDYYCVGYSTVNYFLDNEIIGNLEHQRGRRAKVDVIATFLPRVVVDSLMTALQQANLEMRSLTLEPIAAIHVLIPNTMRKLNVALVDIGAGTSDVAITDDGAIAAYGMVPYAGDEMTDALCDAFILDFPIAEEVKRKLANEDQISFTDILGLDYSLSSNEILSAIEKDIDRLSKEISGKILELNGKAPQAVMLIGGGSLLPLLPEKIAQKLGLPSSRVAVRSSSAIKNFAAGEGVLQGPEFVTPIGIAVAADQHPVRYLSVKVNGATIRIFDLKQLTVGDVLLHSGLDIKRLHGKPGLAISIIINDKVRFIPGTYGSSAIICLNGENAHLDTPIQNLDEIYVEVGQDGSSPDLYLKDLMEEFGTLDLYLNNELYSLRPLITRNGEVVESQEEKIRDRDTITMLFPKNVKEILEYVKCDFSKKDVLVYTVNGITYEWECWETRYMINHQTATLHSSVKQGDQITVRQERRETPLITSLLSYEPRQIEICVKYNGKELRLPSLQSTVMVNRNPLSSEQRLKDQDQIVLTENLVSSVIFSDIFRFIDEDEILKPKQGTRLIIKVNELPATYHTPIKHGDSLELYWE